MRPDIGTIQAADGWRLEWDLSGQAPFDDGRMMPDAIRVYNTERLNNNVSGTISHRDLDRAIRRFLVAHAAQQMVMEW